MANTESCPVFHIIKLLQFYKSVWEGKMLPQSPLPLPSPRPHRLLPFTFPKWVPYILLLNRHKPVITLLYKRLLQRTRSLLLSAEAAESRSLPHFYFLNPTHLSICAWLKFEHIWKPDCKESEKFHLHLSSLYSTESTPEGGQNWCYA